MAWSNLSYTLCVVSLTRQALFIVLLLGWLFVPVYLTAGVRRPGTLSFTDVMTASVISCTDARCYEMCCVR